MRRHRGWWLAVASAISIGGAVLVVDMLALAVRDPVVRRLQYAVPGWPVGKPPLRVVLMTDIHVHNLGRSRDRIARIVTKVNALSPDIVLLGGDLVGGGVQDRPALAGDALTPLGALRPRLATIAVLGNHDHESDAALVQAALRAQHVVVLDNRAIRVGPVTIGGVDDMFTHHGRVGAVVRAMAALGGPTILLSHTPQPFADPRVRGLVLAGHTHCGQVMFPIVGAIASLRPIDRRYLCGIFRERGRTMVVSAGVGTSRLPIRLGVPPDLWMIEVAAGG